ncbi:MAG TPA: hypothetical protein DEO89_02750 [Lachnospiraceae bacterium]|nr:hypothetical protein [Lachnospiraceae bacterium]
MNEKIENKILKIIAECLGLEENQLNEKINEEADLDSLQTVSLVAEIEKQFKIEYSEFAELSLYMNSYECMINYLKNYVEENI